MLDAGEEEKEEKEEEEEGEREAGLDQECEDSMSGASYVVTQTHQPWAFQCFSEGKAHDSRTIYLDGGLVNASMECKLTKISQFLQ